jgi:poly-gamma-glutamate synthesis protein (capsule biosynthesis protein)
MAAEGPSHLTLALTGDVMLGRGVNETIRERGFDYPWGDVVPTLRQADLRFINLECALTSQTTEWRDGGYKPFYFRADPAAVATLLAADIDFASLANNHAGDFGMEGLTETLVVLDRAGIAHGGAGANRAAARAPARFEKNGMRVAVVSFADYPRAWAADEYTPGINFTPVSLDTAVLRQVDDTIADARRGADVLVFCIHWGPNMRARPTGEFRAFARHVVDAGADIFWGHSAHVIQGIEAWHGKLILYDTGDFVDDYMVDPDLRNDLSGIFLVRCGRSKVQDLRLVPTVICDNQVRLATGEDRQWLLERVAALSAEFGTRAVIDEGILRVGVASRPSPIAPPGYLQTPDPESV